ncbi:Qc-SNARE, SYP7-family [Volvox carteri f. nagariensis]|uniref:Qc-SNARE, SYP7-family n=1 Tax=Volvox carteri f. nagariensis TaxID=3068 RepID=D8TW33_VOLCA|nr:Qc-SNARE, SYP7-family [Volvox carteri f. nagariensis]EFJ48298.1 Qc-SNARE, SYP7-family [Volvox carteri f. nagariensis]|eukprot:XP_002950552.1 Qc-SNARE, SYP7-family [Volvox carteri f. nagariensis]
MEEYQEVEAELEKLLEAASDVACEQSRAMIASKNAEIRRAKNVLLTEAVSALEKRVKKGRNINKQIIADRQEKIKDLIERIYAVPDGMSMATNRRPARAYVKGKKGAAVYINGGMDSNPAAQDGYYAHTEATQKFEKEWEEAKKVQDEKLNQIDHAVEELGDMARNYGKRGALVGKLGLRLLACRDVACWTADHMGCRPLVFSRLLHTFEAHPAAHQRLQGRRMAFMFSDAHCQDYIVRQLSTWARPGTELDRQAPIIDDIEQQMDKVTKSLKTNNAKLKGIVSKMRSSRNFCVDIILITVLLAIGAYIYAMFM